MMKIATEDLNRIAAAAASVAKDNTPNPIGRMVHIEASDGWLVAQATDFAYWLTMRAPCEDDLAPTMVSASKLAEVVSKLKADTVEVTCDGEGLHIKAKGSKRKLAVSNASAFPSMPPIAGDGMALDGARLKECLAFCLPFCDASGRAPYDGVNVNGNLFAGTDGKTVARIEYGQDMDCPPVTIPQALIKAIDKIAPDSEVRMRANDKRVSVSWAEGEISGPVVEGAYPDVGRVIPTKGVSDLRVDAAELASASAGVRALGDGRGCIALACNNGNELTVAAQSAQGEATDTISAHADGEPILAGIQQAYLDRVCKGFGKVALTVAINGHDGPMKFTADEASDRLAVVMPMRI